MKNRHPTSPRRGPKGKWYAHPSGYNLELAAQKRARAIEYAEKVRQNLMQKGAKHNDNKQNFLGDNQNKLPPINKSIARETLLEKTQRTMEITRDIHQFIQEHKNANQNTYYNKNSEKNYQIEDNYETHPICLNPKLLEVKSLRHIIQEQSEFIPFDENKQEFVTNSVHKPFKSKYDRELVRLPTESHLIYPDGHMSAAATPDTGRRRFVPAPLQPV